MGRSKGESGRPKTRASSSSLAASLLHGSGDDVVSTMGGFGGFTGSARVEVQSAGSVVCQQATANNEGISGDANGAMMQHLRRLGKKDPTTKLKALAELADSLHQSSKAQLQGILLSWAFYYRQLAGDDNRQVREKAHQVMGVVALTAGRDLAPHLKGIMGPWWVAQFDPSKEVAVSASEAFQVAFGTERKRAEVLGFCSASIRALVDENIRSATKSAPQLSASPDEAAQKLQQLVSSSLLAMAALLDILLPSVPDGGVMTAAARQQLEEGTLSQCREHQWLRGLVQPSSPPAVRRAAYRLLRTLLERLPHLLPPDEVAPPVLAGLEERDASCHPAMWDMLLRLTSAFPEVWGDSSSAVAAMHNLRAFLRHACYGSAAASYPSLLPLLALLTSTPLGGHPGLFPDFLGAVWAGRAACGNADDWRPLLDALQECLCFSTTALSKHTGSQAASAGLVKEVLLDMCWLEYVSSSASPVGWASDLAAFMLGTLSRLRRQKGGDSLVAAFWTGLTALCAAAARGQPSHLPHFASFYALLRKLTPGAAPPEASWVVAKAVSPLVAAVFPVARSTGSAQALDLLTQVVRDWGPAGFARAAEGALSEAGPEAVFATELLPWALPAEGGFEDGLPAMRLLSSFLLGAGAAERWQAVVQHVCGELPWGISPHRAALLLQLLPEFIGQHKGTEQAGEIWHSERLDAAAESIAAGSALLERSHGALLRALLESLVGEQHVSLLSTESARRVLKALLRRVAASVQASHHLWLAPAATLAGAGTLPDNAVQTQDLACAALRAAAPCLTPAHLPQELHQVATHLLAICFALHWATDEGEQCESNEFEDLSLGGSSSESDDGGEGRWLEEVPAAANACSEPEQLQAGDEAHGSEGEGPPGVESVGVLAAAACRAACAEQGRALPPGWRKELSGLLTSWLRVVLHSQGESCPTVATCTSWAQQALQAACHGPEEREEFVALLLLPEQHLSWLRWAEGCDPRDLSAEEAGEYLQEALFAASFLLSAGPEVAVGGTSGGGKGGVQGGVSRPLGLRISLELLCASRSLEHLGQPVLAKAGCVLTRYLSGSGRRESDGGLHLVPRLLEELVEQASRASPPASALYTSSLDALLREVVAGGEWAPDEAAQFVSVQLTKPTVPARALVTALPLVLPLARRAEAVEDLDRALLAWLQAPLDGIPLAACTPNTLQSSRAEELLQVVIACFTPPPEGHGHGAGEATRETTIPAAQRQRLLSVLRYQFSRAVTAATAATAAMRRLQLRDESGPSHAGGRMPAEVAECLAQLAFVVVASCWDLLREDDWAWLLPNVRSWMQAATVLLEECAEVCAKQPEDEEAGGEQDHELSEREASLSVIASLEGVEARAGTRLDQVPLHAINIFALLCTLPMPQAAGASESVVLGVEAEQWQLLQARAFENALRMLLAVGLAETGAQRIGGEYAAAQVAHWRAERGPFFQTLARVVARAPDRAVEAAVRSADLWALGSDSVAALYALLAADDVALPGGLPCAAFGLLCRPSVLPGAISLCLEQEWDGGDQEAEALTVVKLRPELTILLDALPAALSTPDLTSPVRVRCLLGWTLLVERVLALAPAEVARERLVECMQEGNTTAQLLYLLMQHVIPSKPTSRKSAGLYQAVQGAASSAARGASAMEAVLKLWPVTQASVALVAGALYGALLRAVPAFVRVWFVDLRDRAAQTAVESFTSIHCSPGLLAFEFEKVQITGVAMDSLAIRANRSAREVTALYSKEEAALEIVVKLPASYPLRGATVECTRGVGVAEARLRKWLLSISAFLRNQNGAVAQAIAMWHDNVEREFDGVEECPICYSVIHTSNHSLPRLACRTCKHKFHAACLYKWFHSSHKSTCPLCQTAF